MWLYILQRDILACTSSLSEMTLTPLFECTGGYVGHAGWGGMFFSEIQTPDFYGCNSVFQYDGYKCFPNVEDKNCSKTVLLILKCFC